jgi:hypothetical protein
MMMKFLPCLVAVAHGFAATSPSGSVRSELQGAFRDGNLGPNGDNQCGDENGIDLGSAASFAILAKSGISMIPNTRIGGDIGVSPISAAAITGFSLIEDSSRAYSTSTYVDGQVFYPGVSDTKMTTAIGDLETAYTAAAGLANTRPQISGLLTGVTLEAVPGNEFNVYTFTQNIFVANGGSLTLKGDGCDVFVLRTTKDLILGSTASIALDGVSASNVYWQVAGSVTVGTTGVLEGNVLSKTRVVLQTGATLNGRILSQTAVTLDGATVLEPRL